MCFSPSVDFIAGAAIAVVAVDAARHCHSMRQAPLAALPAIFAFHTLISGLVWLGFDGIAPSTISSPATMIYLSIAFVLLPIYVPIAVLLIEPRGWRRWALTGLTLAGLYAGIDYTLRLASGRGYATENANYIDFNITGTSSLSAVLYVVATCGAFLLSGYPRLVTWGVLNVIVVGLLVLFISRGLPSLWCFWAAATSFFIAWFLRDQEHQGLSA